MFGCLAFWGDLFTAICGVPWLGAPSLVRLLGAVAVLGALSGMPRTSVRRLGAILGHGLLGHACQKGKIIEVLIFITLRYGIRSLCLLNLLLLMRRFFRKGMCKLYKQVFAVSDCAIHLD